MSAGSGMASDAVLRPSADSTRATNRGLRPILPGFLLIGFALLVRMVLFNGPFGSDDVVYFARSSEIANGVWSSANYNGALRYGFNIPAGLFIYLFGENYFAANLWPMLCSLAEVGLVYWFAGRYWGRRPALFAGLVVATLPLHISVATRIHTDSIVSFMLSAAFVLLYVGHASGRKIPFFWSGVALGAVFWVKELAAVTFLAFLVFPVLWRRFEKGWFALAAGALAMLFLHFLLMQFLAGDPFHAFRVVLSAVKNNFVDGGDGSDAPFYYFKYLFVDLRHTGLMGFWCVFAILGFRRIVNRQNADERNSVIFVIAWAASLFAVLSWFPVSLSPLRLVLKQSNYLTLFLAPLSLLAGFFLARISRRLGNALLAVTVSLGLLLALLAQADYRVFVSNSKAAVEFAAQHPEARIVGSANNSNLAAYSSIIATGSGRGTPIDAFWEAVPKRAKPTGNEADAKPIYAILDRQTAEWSARGTIVNTARPCWLEVSVLSPIGFGVGNSIVEAGTHGLGLIGGNLSVVRAVNERLVRLYKPAPATVYKVDGGDIWCGMPP